jgi:hypothetical protein
MTCPYCHNDWVCTGMLMVATLVLFAWLVISSKKLIELERERDACQSQADYWRLEWANLARLKLRRDP